MASPVEPPGASDRRAVVGDVARWMSYPDVPRRRPGLRMVGQMFRRACRWLMPPHRLRGLRELVSALGIISGVMYWLGWRLFPGRFRVVSVHPREVDYPVRVRLGSSDIAAFRQIFVDREYSCLDDMADVGVILDCGANVGYAAVYFLSRFPTAHVIAVEPDPENLRLLRDNTAPYGSRVSLVPAAVWSHRTGLVISDRPYRDGRQWARQVRACEPGETANVDAIDVGSLIDMAPVERRSIVKMDVEGAEAIIFAQNFEAWIERVDAIAIELHDDSDFGRASEVFFSAIQGRGFNVSRCGERTVCKRRRAPIHGR